MTSALDTFYALFIRAGDGFWRYALTMLVQTSVLIVALLALDAILRRYTRAVLRYALWMLLLVKLMLPPGLSSPVSVGTWIGRYLDVAPIEQSAPFSAGAEVMREGQGGEVPSVTVTESPTPSESAVVASGAPHVAATGAAATPQAPAESPGRSNLAHTAASLRGFRGHVLTCNITAVGTRNNGLVDREHIPYTPASHLSLLVLLVAC